MTRLVMQRTKLATEKVGFHLDVRQEVGRGLSSRFLIPPFSVFRANDGAWLRRKRQWLALGIESEIGRGGNLLKMSEMAQLKRKKRSTGCLFKSNKSGFFAEQIAKRGGGTSVFDPILCELSYNWWCPKGGQIIDPFAGGSVRGIIAAYMGYKYWGCELRPEQVAANIEQGARIVPDNIPEWVCGNSWFALKKAPNADFLFTCPPYGNLEVYSEIDGDLSNIKEYSNFLLSYSHIIKRACNHLKNDRFACIVVANFRDKQGFYHNFVGDTINIFENSGLRFYNDGILVTSIGTLPLRVDKQFSGYRKLGKTHQNVLVFYKGDTKQIRGNFNDITESE